MVWNYSNNVRGVDAHEGMKIDNFGKVINVLEISEDVRMRGN